MELNIRTLTIFLATTCLGSSLAFAQEEAKTDTVKVEGGDRNVMLNAESANRGPREVNIGLPESVGGTSVMENGLPAVYFFWPEMPYKTWRVDAMTASQAVYDLGKTAVNIGDVGFSMGTFDNLGTDKFQGKGSFGANHFGMHKVDLNISGPLGNKGLKFSAGIFVNMDPGTFSGKKNNLDKYLNDQTQLFKFALTQDYKWSGGKGSVSLMYKYANTHSVGNGEYAPFRYFADGSVEELDGFKIGNDNYIATQIVPFRDAFTGQVREQNSMDDYSSFSHTLDLIGKNQFDNGLYFNYILRGHSGRAGIYLPTMTGIGELEDGTPYQGVMILASRRTPIKSFTSTFELGRKSARHDWKVGINEWVYDIDKFATETTNYSQTVEANPQVIGEFDVDGGFEYHDGTENKTAVFATDVWDIGDWLTLNYGLRIEYMSLRGSYIDNNDKGDADPAKGYIATAKQTSINKDWVNTAASVSATFKLARRFGLLAEVNYNEQTGHLEGYSAGNNPHLKKSRIPEGGIGVYYNSPVYPYGASFSIVSKATYIQRDEYRSTVNFVHPDYAGRVSRTPVSYDIQTFGWTTDIVANNLFKGFDLHFLMTIQAPKYKNYSGTVDFGNGITQDYDYDDNTVTKVSKFLLEIDPSYTWKDLRVWLSARYFSKQYSNMTNSLAFKGRWETFAGVSYQLNKNIGFNVNVVNLLNQRGAQGSISGTDLMTEEQAKETVGKDGAVMSGSYIRPFTVEFGLNYKF